MKIIVIDEEFPYPPDTGKRIRSFNLLSRIASRHTLYYIGYGRKNSDAYKAFEAHGMNPVAVPRDVPPKSGPMFYWRLFGNLFSKHPYIVSSHYSDIFQQTLNELIEKVQPDIVLSEWSPYAVFTRKLTNIKTIIVAHNIEHRIWQRYHENETSSLKKSYIKHQLEKLTSFEKETFADTDGVTVVSQMEKEYLSDFCGQKNIQVVDNGVDLEYFSPSTETPQKNNLVFVGSMNWRPNQDAVTYFVNDIYPILKKEIPDITVNFVGKEPPKQLLKYNELDGINITGGVPDVRPYVNKASAYIVPLRIGGGTRLKILEALSMKKQVISTSVGAEGLHVTDHKDILLADDPESFANRIKEALTNQALSNILADNGRFLVEQRYSWDSIAATLEQFLLSVRGKKVSST